LGEYVPQYLTIVDIKSIVNSVFSLSV
jgi:hypothetical protein